MKASDSAADAGAPGSIDTSLPPNPAAIGHLDTPGRSPAGSPQRASHRTLQLVPPLTAEPAGGRAGDQALAAANRLLELELAEVQEEVEALQELLEELPAIFERKFQQRLTRVLQERRQLEADNRSLRSHLRSLAPGRELEVGSQRPHGLLPPASESAVLPLRVQQPIQAGPAATEPSAMAR